MYTEEERRRCDHLSVIDVGEALISHSLPSSPLMTALVDVGIEIIASRRFLDLIGGTGGNALMSPAG